MKNSTFLGVCGLAAGLASTSLGQLIRPDSATATSEFSGSYVIANTINGSGLPAGFGLADAHATYTTGNHWTTRSGQTIGESATFTFTQPKTLGAFHMWQHRSNNIASNPYYAVTRFDLVFRDVSGTVLANLTNLEGFPNVAVAQTTYFDLVFDVKTVQFIVRETQNNNVSPYTGLAEVAFGPCIAPSGSVASVQVCPGGTATLSVAYAGSGARTFAWRAVDGSGNIIPLSDGPLAGSGATVGGASTGVLTLTGVDSGVESYAYECVITNPCGTATIAGTVTLCRVDHNCDGFVDFFDYDDYVVAFESGEERADFNGDGFLDFFDYDDFVTAFERGC